MYVLLILITNLYAVNITMKTLYSNIILLLIYMKTHLFCLAKLILDDDDEIERQNLAYSSSGE